MRVTKRKIEEREKGYRERRVRGEREEQMNKRKEVFTKGNGPRLRPTLCNCFGSAKTCLNNWSFVFYFN